MTNDEYENIYFASMTQMDLYVAQQVTHNQKLFALHSKRTVEMNKEFYRHLFVNGPHHGCIAIMCSRCGALCTNTYSPDIKHRMAQERICFFCDHWEQVANTLDEKRLVIGGDTYKDGGNSPTNSVTGRRMLGFGGNIWHIRRMDAPGTVWETNNLWHGGTVPQEWRHLLPDNAEFVKNDIENGRTG